MTYAPRDENHVPAIVAVSSTDGTSLVIPYADPVTHRLLVDLAGSVTIGITVSGGTEGSVLFVGTGGVLAQDNDNFFWDDTNTQLTIGSQDTVASGTSQFPLVVGGTVNDYLAVEIQNLSSGDSASTDISISANNDGTALVGHYVDLGINGSGYIAINAGNIKTVSVSAGGSGYTVGDVLTIVGGDSNATVTVATVSGGAVTSVTLTDNGTGYSVASALATTGGTGTGCAINVLTLIDNSGLAANDGYLYTSGGNMSVFTDTASKNIQMFIGGFGTTNERVRITNTGSITNVPFVTSTATTTTPLSYTLFPAVTGTANLQTIGTSNATTTHVLADFNTTDAHSSGLVFYKSGSGTVGSATVVASGERLGYLAFSGAQQTGTFSNQSIAASIAGYVDGTVTSGASADMPGRIVFSTSADSSGTPTDRLIIDSSGVFKPATNDGVALGTTALSFSDLFLASGAVVNFNNGNMTVTHSAGALAFAGGTVTFTGGAVTPATNDAAALGTSSLMWSDLFLASGSVINWNNGDLTLTHSSNLLTLAGGQLTFGANTAYFVETDNGNSSTADTIDWTLSNKQKSTLTGNVTYTFTAPGGPCSLVLKVGTGTGGFSITWPATVHWSGGVAPTPTATASKVDVYTFYYDGTTYFGNSSLNYAP